MVTIDNMNQRILALLEEDGRRTYSEIASILKRSESTVRDRIRRMEQRGVIRGYTTIIDKKFLGYSVEALVLCNVLDESKAEKVIDELAQMEEIIHVYLVSGERRIALRVIASDHRSLELLLRRKISPIGVKDISLYVVTEAPVGLCVRV